MVSIVNLKCIGGIRNYHIIEVVIQNNFGVIGLNFNFRSLMDPYYLRISTAYDNTPGDLQFDGTNKRIKTAGSIRYYSTFSS